MYKLRHGSEALIVIADDKTSKIHVGRDPHPEQYLARMQAQVGDEATFSIVALAFRLGRATPLVRRKLQGFRIRNSWYTREALDVLQGLWQDAPLAPSLDAWIAELVIEAQTGVVTPLVPAGAIDRGFEPSDFTRLGQAFVTNKAPAYNYPRRRRGRPPTRSAIVDRDLKPENIEPAPTTPTPIVPRWVRTLVAKP